MAPSCPLVANSAHSCCLLRLMCGAPTLPSERIHQSAVLLAAKIFFFQRWRTTLRRRLDSMISRATREFTQPYAKHAFDLQLLPC